MEGGDANNVDSGSDFIDTAATSIEEEVIQQDKRETALKQELMQLSLYCQKRLEEIAQLRRTKWEVEEKLQVLNIQNEVINKELANEQQQLETEVLELTKLEEALKEEKSKQIKIVEEYEKEINQLCQKLDRLPSIYDKEQVCIDIKSFKEMTKVNKEKLIKLAEDIQLYKEKYNLMKSGEEIRLINILGSIRTEMQENASNINLENEKNEEMLQRLKEETMQLKHDIAKFLKFTQESN